MHRQRLSRKESYWLTMVRLVAYVTCSRSSISQRYVSSLLYRNVGVNEVCFVSTVEVCCFVVVAVLWGATNPFLKKGTEGIERVKKGNIILQFLAEVKFLFLNFKVKSCSPRIQLLCTDIWRRICESCWIKNNATQQKCSLFWFFTCITPNQLNQFLLSAVFDSIPAESRWICGLLLHFGHHRW